MKLKIELSYEEALDIIKKDITNKYAKSFPNVEIEVGISDFNLEPVQIKEAEDASCNKPDCVQEEIIVKEEKPKRVEEEEDAFSDIEEEESVTEKKPAHPLFGSLTR